MSSAIKMQYLLILHDHLLYTCSELTVTRNNIRGEAKSNSIIGKYGKISAQLHTTLCIQFLDRENNDQKNTLPLRKQICFTIVWGCAKILPINLL